MIDRKEFGFRVIIMESMVGDWCGHIISDAHGIHEGVRAESESAVEQVAAERIAEILEKIASAAADKASDARAWASLGFDGRAKSIAATSDNLFGAAAPE